MISNRNKQAGVCWRSFFAAGLLLCLVAMFSLNAPVGLAQDVKGAIRGIVTDEQGAAIDGAEVTISDQTGFSLTTTTVDGGLYNFSKLPLGTFKIRVTHAGFKAYEQEAFKIRVTHAGFKAYEQVGIVLHAADSLAFNIALKLGAVSEQVTVEASAIQVDTTNGELAGLIDGKQVAELPLNGRNFMQLVLGVPGVAAGEGFSNLGKGLKGGSDLSVSGGAVDS